MGKQVGRRAAFRFAAVTAPADVVPDPETRLPTEAGTSGRQP